MTFVSRARSARERGRVASKVFLGGQLIPGEILVVLVVRLSLNSVSIAYDHMNLIYCLNLCTQGSLLFDLFCIKLYDRTSFFRVHIHFKNRQNVIFAICIFAC